MKSKFLGVIAFAFVVATSCGGSGETEVRAEARYNMSTPVVQYLDSLVSTMQQNSLHRATINWTKFRDSVFTSARGATTIASTYPGIQVALQLLGDGHSTYRTVTGEFLRASNRTCIAPIVANATVPDGIGYVRVVTSNAQGVNATAYANAVQSVIRGQDRADLTGWIVDLRGNTGGNMWPMIAGLGSIVGNGVLGHFVFPTGVITPWEFHDGGSYSNGKLLQAVDQPYQLLHANPRVAVLVDNRVESSGEATFIAFRGRANTRSFGSATCGLSTANQTFPMTDGAGLTLTVALMADRAKNPFGDSIVPDEVIADPATAVQRAITWLQTP